MSYIPKGYKNFSSLNKINKILMISKVALVILFFCVYFFRIIIIQSASFEIKNLIIYSLGIFIFVINMIIIKILNKIKFSKALNKVNIDINYIRSIPKNIPVTYALFVNNNKIQYEKTIKLTIQNLYCKGAISLKIENDNVIIEKTNNEVNLSDSENYIYNYLFSEDKNNFNMKDWNDTIKKELINSEYINKTNKYKITKQYFIIFSILFLPFTIYYLNYSFTTINSNDMLDTLIYSVMFALLPISIIYLYEKFNVFSDLCLTKEGYVLKKQLLLLRNYIKDFTRLNEKEIKEIPLWKEYLLYAQILNINFKYKNIEDISMKKLSDADLKNYVNDFLYRISKIDINSNNNYY